MPSYDHTSDRTGGIMSFFLLNILRQIISSTETVNYHIKGMPVS